VKLTPSLLDQWLLQKHTAQPPIEFDLASNTGPVMTLHDIIALSDEDLLRELLHTPVSYISAAGSTELRNAIGQLQGVDGDAIQIVTGASEALLIFCFLAAEPGANVVLPDLGYPSNTAIAASLGLEVRLYRLRAEANFQLDVDQVAKLIDRETRFLLVNSPNNPTGAVIGDSDMEILYQLCEERGVQFISDEVYHPIFHGPPSQSAARFPNATVVGDLSKSLCLSGLRVGWIVDRNHGRIERYNNARKYFTICNSPLGEKLATAAVRHSRKIYDQTLSTAAKNLALLEPVLATHSDLIRYRRPGGGMTAFPALVSGDDSRSFCLRLARRGVLVTPGDCFGRPGHFRVGFAASGDRFSSALERFDYFLNTESWNRR